MKKKFRINKKQTVVICNNRSPFVCQVHNAARTLDCMHQDRSIDRFLLLTSSCIASLKDLTHKTVHIFDKLAFSDFLQKNLKLQK